MDSIQRSEISVYDILDKEWKQLLISWTTYHCPLLSVGDAGKVFSEKEKKGTLCKFNILHMKNQYSI